MQQGFQEGGPEIQPADATPRKSNEKIKKKLSWLKGLVKLPESPSKIKLPSHQSPSLSRKSSLASFKDMVLSNMGRSDSSLSLHDPGAPALRLPTQHVLFPALSIAMLRQTPKIHTKRLPPLLKAIYTGDLKKVNGIVAKSGPGELDFLDPLHGFAPLHLAIEMESLLIVRELLGTERGDITSQQFANPDVADFQGRTSLMLAAVHESAELMGLLVDAHADVNAADAVGCSPLHYSLLTENLDCMRLLIEHDANLQVFDKSGKSLLHHAIIRQKSRIALFLIEHGCDINALDSDKRTPLHEAVALNLKSVTHLLIEKGADRDAMDSQGKRPVDLMNFQSFDQDLFDALVGNHDNGYLSHDYLVRQNQESSPEHQQVAETSNQVESLFSHYENVKRQSLLTETATEHTEVPEKRVSSSGSDVVSFGENDDSVNETSSQSAMLSHPNEEFDMETDSHSAMLSHPDEFDMEEEESDASESSEVVSFEEETGSEAEEGNSSISAVEPSLRLGLTTEGDDSEAEPGTDDDFEISAFEQESVVEPGQALENMSLSEEEFDTDTDEPSIEKNLPSPPADKENDDTIGVTFVEAFRNPTPDLQIAVQSTPVETMDEQPDESVTEVLDFEHVQPLERPDTVTGITEIFQAENELDQGAISVIEPRQRVDSHLVETNTSFHTALDHTRGNSSFDSTSTMERRQIDQDVDEEVEELEELDLLLQESSMDQRTPIIPASRSIDEFSAEQTPTIRSLNDVRSIHASALEVAQLVAEMKAKDESIADLSQQTFELTHRETELQLQLANLSEKLKLSEIQRRRFSGNYDGHLESLERQIQEEKAMRNQLLAENEVLSEKCSQCQASLEQLEARYNLELNEFNEMKESEDQLINSIQNLKKNVSSSQFDLQERGRENRELEGIVSSQEKLLQGLTSKVSEAEETIQKLSLSKKELAVVKKEKTDLESDMVRMSRELDKVLPENKTLLDECEYLKTALDETESENRTLKSENNAMAIRLRSLEKENASISEDLGAQTTRSKSAIDQLTVNYESLIEDLEEKNQRVDDCIGRLQTLATCYETKIENLQTQLEKTRDAHQGLTLENNRLKTELKNVTGALSSNELTLVQLQRHTEETRAQQGEHKISLKLSEDKTRAVQSQLKEAHNEWALKESLLLEELAEYKSKERQNAERNETGALHQARIDNDQLREMILDKDLYLDIFQKELSKSQVLVRDSQVLLQTLQEMKAQEEIAKISLPLSQAGKENASIQSPERRQHSHSQKESLTESYSSEKGKARREKSLGLDQPLTRSMLEPQSPVRLNRGEIFNYSHIDSTRNNPSKVILSPSRKPLDRIDLDLLSPKVALILLRRRQRVSQDRDTD